MSLNKCNKKIKCCKMQTIAFSQKEELSNDFLNHTEQNKLHKVSWAEPHSRFPLEKFGWENICLGKKFDLKKCGSKKNFGQNNVFLHISSSWFKLRLHTGNQLPGLSRSPLEVWLGGVVGGRWWSYSLLCHSKLELRLSWGCDNICGYDLICWDMN